MRLKIALVVLAMSALSLGGAYPLDDYALLQSFLVGVSSSLLVFGIGIVAVNIYFEADSRKHAGTALFAYCQKSIVDFHNDFLDAAWSIFGRESFGRIQSELVEGKFDASVLSADVRQRLYDMYVSSRKLRDDIIVLEAALAEISRLMTWSLDSRALLACLTARVELTKLRFTALDGSRASVDAVTAIIVQVDMLTQIARAQLMSIAGIRDGH